LYVVSFLLFLTFRCVERYIDWYQVSLVVPVVFWCRGALIVFYLEWTSGPGPG
jgi:hypothetical protein